MYVWASMGNKGQAVFGKIWASVHIDNIGVVFGYNWVADSKKNTIFSIF